MMTCQILLAAALLAQDPKPNAVNIISEVRTGNLVVGTSVLALTDRRPVDEQIEVMRALLLRKLQATGAVDLRMGNSAEYMQQQYYQAVTTPDGKTTTYEPRTYYTPAAETSNVVYWGQHSFGHNPTVDDTYLHGYGVVFTVTLPATDRDPRPGSEAPRGTPGLSDWEKTRRQLRGEPVPERAASAPKEPVVGDVLLKLMAENGKHFTGLKDDERVTIAVAFRGPVPHRAAVWRQAEKTSQAGTTNASGSSFTGAADVQGGTTTGSAPGTSAGTSNANGETRDQELLGDLHLKQGQPQQAIDAYHKAIRQADAELSAGGDERATAARLADYYSKLAQAQLAAGKLDDARGNLDRAKAIREKTARTPPQAPGAKPVASGLPARLTISAPKTLLDQVGAGKMSMDEFRKAATVEYVPAGKAVE